MKRATRLGTAAFMLAVLTMLSSAARSADAVSLAETGSTLMYPLLEQWTMEYRKAVPNVRIPVAATNSGAGIEQAIAGRVQFGASDAYMTDEQMSANPGMLNIPLVISAQFVTYNLPGLNAAGLRLDGPTLAGIYTGKVRNWDDAAIVAMNAGVQLPHAAIVPVHRSDSSGDSFIFSQYLTFSTDSWEFGPSYGTDISWPSVPGAQGAAGNIGMVKAVGAAPYSIGYVGGSFFREVAAAHLGTAMLKNQAGNFVAPTPQTVRDAAAELDARTPHDERLSLVFAPGADSYPLVNYEYAIVAAKQPNPQTAAALRDFLLWTIGAGKGNDQKALDPLHFTTLPEFVRALSDAQIRLIN
ncbi:MAG: phosphate ABC transporter substrate-binding protein PstS [Candidatus Velthaea sp.]